ncbi:MAG: hypothetical protein ABIK18_06005 [candidate division WOR-3 bacterium]
MKSKKIRKKRSRRLRGHPEPEWLEEQEETVGLGEEFDADFLEQEEEPFNPDFEEPDESEW